MIHHALDNERSIIKRYLHHRKCIDFVSKMRRFIRMLDIEIRYTHTSLDDCFVTLCCPNDYGNT